MIENWKLNQNLLIKIYKTLIRSVLDYACVSLGRAYSRLKKEFRDN
jgi:hypothetical protein